ncbi:MAG: hypothetical protein Q8Q18_01150, partial [bacterium]|nr:hypothetical protein [bacterium]
NFFPNGATSTNLTFNGGLTGALTGNADTATALSANGANCSAGQAPLGVDDSGAAEGCFSVATFAYLFPSNATTTILSFTNGLTAYGSTTIGNGTAQGGLTIDGTATTTNLLVVQGSGTSTFSGGLTAMGLASQYLTVTGVGTSTFAGSVYAAGGYETRDGFTLTESTLTGTSKLSVDVTGDLVLSASGGDVRAYDENLWICQSGGCPSLTATSTAGNIFIEEALHFRNGWSFGSTSTDPVSNLILFDATGEAAVIFDQAP